MTITRRRAAAYLVDGLDAHRSQRVDQVAAWLVTSHRQQELSHLLRDVDSLLAERGYVRATATTAEPLTTSLKTTLEAFIKHSTGAKTVELQSTIDHRAVGGLRLTLPDSELDSTISTKLRTFVTEMSK